MKSAQEMGWDELKNGKLIAAAAAASFDLILTVDQHIKEQQNLSRLPLAIIVLIARSNRSNELLPLLPHAERIISTLKIGQLVEIDSAGNVRVITPGRDA